MAILPDTTLSPGDIERAKDPLNVALAMFRIAEHTLQMEEQQGYGVWRMGQSVVIRRARREVYRKIEEVERLAEGKSLPEETLKEIKEVRLRFPRHPQV